MHILQFGTEFSYLMKQKNDFTDGNVSSTQQQDFNNDNVRKNTYCLPGALDFNLDNLVLGYELVGMLKTMTGTEI